MDAKTRLVGRICHERFGWRPVVVGRLLVLAESTVNRRRVEAHRMLMTAVLPGTRRDLVEWLREPKGMFAGVIFLPVSRGVVGKRRGGGPSRVRAHTPRSEAA